MDRKDLYINENYKVSSFKKIPISPRRRRVFIDTDYGLGIRFVADLIVVVPCSA